MTRLVVFARPPVAGAAKTRLVPAVGAETAAKLAEAFLGDTLAKAAAARDATGVRVELWSAEDPKGTRTLSGVRGPRVIDPLAAVADAHGASLHAQPAGDLGVRMRAAIDAGAPAVIVGTDAPTLPVALLVAAVRALDAHDIVLGPAADGGYWLIGARAPLPPSIFDGVPWSDPRTRAATLAGALRLGLGVALLAPWYDVDTPEDLRLLRAHLSVAPGDAPLTAAVLLAVR